MRQLLVIPAGSSFNAKGLKELKVSARNVVVRLDYIEPDVKTIKTRLTLIEGDTKEIKSYIGILHDAIVELQTASHSH